jgi:hypothetical protein
MWTLNEPSMVKTTALRKPRNVNKVIQRMVRWKVMNWTFELLPSKVRIEDLTPKNRVASVLAFRRIALRYFVLTDFYNEAHVFGLIIHPKANSLIRNPFRTETNTCNREREQRSITSPRQFALGSALASNFVMFVCSFSNFNNVNNLYWYFVTWSPVVIAKSNMFPMLICFVSGDNIGDFNFLWSFTIVSPSYNIGSLGNSSFDVQGRSWRWKQQVPPKRWHLSTRLYGVRFQETVIFVFTVVRSQKDACTSVFALLILIISHIT